MCNLYSITTNQAAIAALFRIVLRHEVTPSMPGVFPGYPAPVTRGNGEDRDIVMMRWECRHLRELTTGDNIRNTSSPALPRLVEARTPMPGAVQQLGRICAGAEPRDEDDGCGLVCVVG
ncbi:hypothetical protein BRAO285_1800025 [Bradyrhizobium sp. ORS 285]|nr:hypothetical protein BRAO285_1800025 [Bradyrhizobium sp. ORS 285]